MNHQDTKAPRTEPGELLDALARAVVDAAFAVHSQLGPGLLESVYEVCLVHELIKRGLNVERQVALPVQYDGLTLEAGLRLDLLIAGQLIVELKAVEALLPVHKAQMLTYLKLSNRRLGLLINFNVPLIKDGIKRLAFVNHQDTKIPREDMPQDLRSSVMPWRLIDSAPKGERLAMAHPCLSLVSWCLGGSPSL